MSESTDNSSNNKQQKYNRFKSLINDLKKKFPHKTQHIIAIVSVSEQKLYLINDNALVKEYMVSTAEAGTGNQSGSYKTPLGIHCIAEKFGENAPIASIFKARKNTHQIAKILHDPEIRSDQDNITSRILWLEGLEEGLNKGSDKEQNNVDSYSRYIYIHGTDEEGLLGQIASHGCVRMANHDVIELFDLMEIGDFVVIIED